MHTFEEMPAAVAHWFAVAAGWIWNHGASLAGIAFVLVVVAALLALGLEAIRPADPRRTAEYRIARQRERQASARAQELLDAHPDYQGLQIATMTPAAYHYVREQLTAEGLWTA